MLEKDVEQHMPVHEHVMEKGKAMLDSMKPGREKDNLQQKLEDLDTRWNQLSENISQRNQKLKNVEPSASKYVNSIEPFTNWLAESEERLKSCEKIPEDEESTTQQIELLEVSLVLRLN